MKRREDPTTDPPPIDRAKVRAILGAANVLRESGVSLHHHPIMEKLEEASGHPLAYYIFISTVDTTKLSSAELDDLTDGLLKGRVARG